MSVDYLNSVATVFVDGKKIGKLHFPAGELDLTAAVQPGGKHVLSIFVEALPLKETMLAFNDTNMPQEMKGSVNYRGLCGDVFLVSTPAQARVTNVKVDPSVRQWALTVHADLANLASGADYKLQAKISDQGRPVKTLTSAAFKDADLKNGRFSFTQAMEAGEAVGPQYAEESVRFGALAAGRRRKDGGRFPAGALWFSGILDRRPRLHAQRHACFLG